MVPLKYWDKGGGNWLGQARLYRAEVMSGKNSKT